MEDEKTRERALVLKRLYWLDILYSIGRNRRIPYFLGTESYWSLNHDEAAFEIAKAINDDELLVINTEFPPRYVSLGSFQGRFYKATEKGEIQLGSAWEEVRKNVRKSLQKHGERAFGLLQAIINKGGTSAFFPLITEIENVLGYEFYPSVLLPKLSAYKLVFKTGSNLSLIHI